MTPHTQHARTTKLSRMTDRLTDTAIIGNNSLLFMQIIKVKYRTIDTAAIDEIPSSQNAQLMFYLPIT